MKIYLITILASLFLAACIPAVQAQRTLVTDHLKANQKITLSGESRTKFNQFYSQTSAPTGTLHEGDIWYDTDDFLLWVHTGSAWEQVTTASSSPDSSIYATVYRTDTLSQNIRDEVAAAGYLTSEVDGSITNEIQTAGEVVSSAVGNVTAVDLQGAIRQLDSLITSGIVSATSKYRGNATTATDPGTPSVPVFYTTTITGVYTNFDALEVTESFAILAYDTTGGGGWTLSEVDVLGARGAVIDELEQKLLGNIVYAEVAKDVSTATNNASASHYWGMRDQFINGSTRQPDSIKIYAPIAGSFYVNYYRLDGTTANIIHADTFTVTLPDTGVVAFKIDTAGLSLSADTTYIGIKPSVAGIYRYSTVGAPFLGFYVPGSNPDTLIERTTENFTYWVRTYGLSPALIDSLPGLAERVTALENGGEAITGTNLQSVIDTSNYIILPSDTITLSAPINVPGGRTIVGSGNTVVKTTGDAFRIANADDITIRNITFLGDFSTPDVSSSSVIADTSDAISMAGVGSDDGIQITGTSSKIVIDNCRFFNFDQSGLNVNAGGGAHPREGVLIASNLFAQNCYVGIYVQPAAEYNTFNNIKSTNCLMGLRVHGGNNYFSNLHCNGDRIGLFLGDSGNNSHGSISNSAFNHNFLYAILVDDIDYGFYFSACENFDGPIYLIRSVGFSWIGGYTAGNIQYTGGVGNLFHSTIFGADSVDEGNATILNLKNNIIRDTGASTGINN